AVPGEVLPGRHLAVPAEDQDRLPGAVIEAGALPARRDGWRCLPGFVAAGGFLTVALADVGQAGEKAGRAAEVLGGHRQDIVADAEVGADVEAVTAAAVVAAAHADAVDPDGEAVVGGDLET